MTLRSFLDAAQALIVEEHQRLGMSLPEALDEVDPWRAGGPRKDQDQPAQRQTSKTAAATTAAQNDQALQALQMMMAGATKA